MTLTEAQNITAERLDAWKNDLRSIKATPICLVSLEPRETGGSDIHFFVVEDLTDEQILEILSKMVDVFKSKTN